MPRHLLYHVHCTVCHVSGETPDENGISPSPQCRAICNCPWEAELVCKNTFTIRTLRFPNWPMERTSALGDDVSSKPGIHFHLYTSVYECTCVRAPTTDPGSRSWFRSVLQYWTSDPVMESGYKPLRWICAGRAPKIAGPRCIPGSCLFAEMPQVRDPRLPTQHRHFGMQPRMIMRGYVY